MVNGYSSLVPPFHMKLYAELHEFPTESGLAELERLGVNYVIVHTDMYQPDRWAEKEKDIAAFGAASACSEWKARAGPTRSGPAEVSRSVHGVGA